MKLTSTAISLLKNLEVIIMRFSEYCETVENTEQEQQLLQFMKQDKMKDAEKVFEKLSRIPVVGKLFSAVIALGDYESIEAYKQSEHYDNIKDWRFTIDYDKNSLSIGMNEEQQKKALKVLAIFGAIITLIVIARKLGCCKNKERTS